MSRNPGYHSRFETVKQSQLENSANRYGLRESVLIAVVVVMLLCLLTKLLVVRMSRCDRARDCHKEQAHQNTKGPQTCQEVFLKGLFQRIDLDLLGLVTTDTKTRSDP